MSEDYLYTPPDEAAKNPYTLGSQSKEHIHETFKRMETDVIVARNRLQDAQEKHFSGDWKDEQILCAAEEALDAAEERLEHSRQKYKWEAAEKWKERFPLTASIIARTKSLLCRVDWDWLLRKDKKKK